MCVCVYIYIYIYLPQSSYMSLCAVNHLQGRILVLNRFTGCPASRQCVEHQNM